MMGEVLKAVLLSLSMLDKLENDVFETFKDSEYPKSWMYKQIRQHAIIYGNDANRLLK